MLTRRIDVRAALGLGAVAVIWGTALGATQLAAGHSAIAIAAAFDVSVTAALALYVIAVRRGHLPRWTVPLTATLGLVVARVAFGRRSDVGGAVMATAALIEIAMIAVTIVGARRAVRSWRSTRSAPLLDRFDAAFTAVGVPARVARVVATEVTLFAYAVIGWRAPARAATRFTVHRTGGWAMFAGVLVFLTVVETAVVHIALSAYASPTAAWVVTAMSIYAAIWLVGDVHALRHGGVTVTAEALELAMGVRWGGRIPWSAVVSVQRGAAPSGPGVVDASILGANVVLHLRTPCGLRGLLGRHRQVTTLALSIDDLDRFVAMVEEVLPS